MELNDGITLPAKVKVLRETPEESLISISIREGRKRQIRRMFRQLQKPLLALRREKIGELSVEGLESGKYRELTKKEIQYLYSL